MTLLHLICRWLCSWRGGGNSHSSAWASGITIYLTLNILCICFNCISFKMKEHLLSFVLRSLSFMVEFIINELQGHHIIHVRRYIIGDHFIGIMQIICGWVIFVSLSLCVCVKQRVRRNAVPSLAPDVEGSGDDTAMFNGTGRISAYANDQVLILMLYIFLCICIFPRCSHRGL